MQSLQGLYEVGGGYEWCEPQTDREQAGSRGRPRAGESTETCLPAVHAASIQPTSLLKGRVSGARDLPSKMKAVLFLALLALATAQDHGSGHSAMPMATSGPRDPCVVSGRRLARPRRNCTISPRRGARRPGGAGWRPGALSWAASSAQMHDRVSPIARLAPCALSPGWRRQPPPPGGKRRGKAVRPAPRQLRRRAAPVCPHMPPHPHTPTPTRPPPLPAAGGPHQGQLHVLQAAARHRAGRPHGALQGGLAVRGVGDGIGARWGTFAPRAAAGGRRAALPCRPAAAAAA